MKKNGFSRTNLYVIIVVAFLLLVNVLLGFALIRQSSAAMRSLIESRMLDISNTASVLLDGDTLKVLEAEDKGTEEYLNVLRMLTCFKENIGLEYIYCVRDLGNGEFVFTVDSDAEAPGEFGQHIAYTDALHMASLGTPAVDKVPYEDSWGRFYSAYSPVFDSQGKVAGIVAVDFSAEWFEDQISGQVRTTLLVSGISLLFAIAIVLLITTGYRKRFGMLFHEMNRVSDGIETLVQEASPGMEIVSLEEETVHSNDEITELGEKIRALQNKLSEQIAIVRSQAYIDGLTKLGNRAAYEDHAKRIDGQIQEGTADFSIAVFDLNGLKEINDKYGHEKGDKFIIEASAFLRGLFDGDKLYRIGGDEFIAVLEGAHRKTRAWLDEAFADQNHPSISRGFAVYEPGTDADYRMVFNRADNEMYNDKKAYYRAHGDRRGKR